ncbi:MAG: leucine-rich repeat domain-containing protein [Nitrosopumilus sp.]|nr:leucine-rich repeat domain-containing protein [Nitrosopumilus sp.]
MSLNRDVLTLIAQLEPNLALSSTNSSMHKIVNEIFESAAKYMEKEEVYYNHSQALVSRCGITSAQYFLKQIEKVQLEAQRLSNKQSDFPQLSNKDKIVWGYLNFKSLVEEVKMNTEKVQQEDFKKFIEVVVQEIDQPILKGLEPLMAWEIIKENHWEVNVGKLDLSEKNIKFLSIEIGSLTNLIELNLAHNQLITIPKEINSLTLLQTLNLDDNKLVNVPDYILLPNLQRYELRYNDLEQSPNLNCYPKLKWIYLHHNRIKEIPSDVETHPTLMKIFLKYNLITQIPSPLSDRIEIDVLDEHSSSQRLTSDRFEDV